MLNSQTRLVKPAELIDVSRRESGDAERPVNFRFLVTWSFLFEGFSATVPAATPVVSREDRVHTLGATASAAQAQPETTALTRTSVEAPPEDWQKPMPSSEVSWEMVVPRMVRPASKSSLAEQVIPQTHRLAPAENPEPGHDTQAPAATLASKLKGISRIQLIRGGVGLGITLLGIAGLLMVHQWMPRTKPIAPPKPAGVSLKLEAEPQGTGMINIKWNAASSAIAQAREARLVIMERDQQPETISLAPEQLKIGHLSYGSTAESVGLRLEVVDRSGAIAQESVSLVSPRAPAVAPSQPPVPTKGPAAEASNASSVKPKVEEPATKSSAAQTSRGATREFKLPPSSGGKTVSDPGERSGGEVSSTLPVPSAGVPSVNAIPSAIRLLDPVGRIPAPQVKESPAARQPETPVASAPKTPVVNAPKAGGDLQPGKLVKKVTPAYPAMAVTARVQGAVRFAAVIGKDGTVQNVRVLSGSQMLVPAATDAVKQWVYQPTLLNGQPVEVQTQIEVFFNLTK